MIDLRNLHFFLIFIITFTSLFVPSIELTMRTVAVISPRIHPVSILARQLFLLLSVLVYFMLLQRLHTTAAVVVVGFV
jgi:hypothetical protein